MNKKNDPLEHLVNQPISDGGFNEGIPSNLLLDRLEAGLLDAEKARQLDAYLQENKGNSLVTERSKLRADFHTQLPKDAFIRQMNTLWEKEQAAEVSQEKKATPLSVWQRINNFVRPELWLAALASLVVIISIPLLNDTPDPIQGIRIKGNIDAPALDVYRLRAGDITLLPSDSLAEAGDRLQFVVYPGDFPFMMIINLDDQGLFSAYYPDIRGDSLPLGDGQDPKTGHLLDGSIELDDFTGQERIVLLLSQTPLSVLEVHAACEDWKNEQLNDTHTLPLHSLFIPNYLETDGAFQVAFDLEKE